MGILLGMIILNQCEPK